MVTYLLIGSILLLAGILLWMQIHKIKVRRRVEAERRTREEKAAQREALARKQRELGDKLFMALASAAQKNTLANILDGKPADGYDLLQVGRIIDNGGGYSIFPSMPTTQRFNGNSYSLAQIDIRTKDTGREIHVFQAPYGPDAYYPESQFEQVLSGLIRYVENYRMFRPKGMSAFDEVFRPAA